MKIRLLTSCVLLVILQLIYQTTRFATEIPDLSSTDVDAVYTWVQTPNEKQLDNILKICPEERDPEVRWRDLGTMQVSLELLLKNLPWLRNIHIVTNGQFPCWLRAHSKIKRVSHVDIWSAEFVDRLPVFSSMPIEAHLHRIPDLAERFIYLNDDHFFLKPLSRGQLFSVQGVPNIFGHSSWWLKDNSNSETDSWWRKELCKWDWERLSNLCSPLKRWKLPPQLLVDASDWPPKEPRATLAAHMPYLWKKSWIAEIQQTWPQLFAEVRGARCRGPGKTYKSVQCPTAVYNWYHLMRGSKLVRDVRTAFARDKAMKTRSTDPAGQERLKNIQVFFDGLRASQPSVLCLNDNFDESGNVSVLQPQLDIMNEWLQEVRLPMPDVVDESLCDNL